MDSALQILLVTTAKHEPPRGSAGVSLDPRDGLSPSDLVNRRPLGSRHALLDPARVMCLGDVNAETTRRSWREGSKLLLLPAQPRRG